jgi:hypothetical protein
MPLLLSLAQLFRHDMCVEAEIAHARMAAANALLESAVAATPGLISECLHLLVAFHYQALAQNGAVVLKLLYGGFKNMNEESAM